MFGDNIFELPINNNTLSDMDLELLYNIFQQDEKDKLSAGKEDKSKKFKIALFVTILYAVFSLPFIKNLVNTYSGNSITGYFVLIVAFGLCFLLLQKITE